MAKVPFLESFSRLRRRNKFLFTFILLMALVLFWKGALGFWDIIFDEFLFKNHTFWSNFAALVVGFLILFFAGLAISSSKVSFKRK